MLAERLTPILNVSNIQQSFAWFEKLGWKKAWEWGTPPDFGGVCSGECGDGVDRQTKTQRDVRKENRWPEALVT